MQHFDGKKVPKYVDPKLDGGSDLWIFSKKPGSMNSTGTLNQFHVATFSGSLKFLFPSTASLICISWEQYIQS